MKMTETIGFIGVGTMGGPMAANLQHAGKRVIVHDIRREAAKTLCDHGAIWVDDFQSMRRETDVIVTSLPGPPQIEQVAFDENGLVAALGSGALWIDTSSNSVSLAPRLAAACGEARSIFVDAPVTGGAVGAREGTLTIMAGGEDAAIARAKPVLDIIGGNTVHTGSIGTGCAMKLVLNFLSISTTGLVAEALTLGRASGLTLDTLLAVLTGGYGDSVVLHDTVACAKGARAWEFAASLARKDVALAVELSKQLNLPSPYGEMTVGLLDECLANSDSPDDVWSMVEAYERNANTQIV